MSELTSGCEPEFAPTPTPTNETKQFRKALDYTLQNLKLSNIANGPAPCRFSHERATAILKIQEAIMWLGMDLKDIGETPNPYPHSYDPSSPVIEPTADNLKL